MQKKSFVNPLSPLLAGALLSVAATSAMAQTTPVPSNPTTVGVTPQEAAEATRKAVPRADTGTVVRTDESVADRAREAVDAAKPQVTSTPNAATTTSTPMTTAPMVTTPSNNAAVSNTTTTRSTTKQVRRARADRN